MSTHPSVQMTTSAYLARACLCGAPRSQHAYTYVNDGAGQIVLRILPMTDDPCAGFVDAIEREIGYPAGIDPTGRPTQVVHPAEADPGGD